METSNQPIIAVDKLLACDSKVQLGTLLRSARRQLGMSAKDLGQSLYQQVLSLEKGLYSRISTNTKTEQAAKGLLERLGYTHTEMNQIMTHAQTIPRFPPRPTTFDGEPFTSALDKSSAGYLDAQMKHSTRLISALAFCEPAAIIGQMTAQHVNRLSLDQLIYMAEHHAGAYESMADGVKKSQAFLEAIPVAELTNFHPLSMVLASYSLVDTALNIRPEGHMLSSVDREYELIRLKLFDQEQKGFNAGKEIRLKAAAAKKAYHAALDDAWNALREAAILKVQGDQSYQI